MSDLITALQDPHRYPHPVTTVRVIETHISWVLLTGRYAYKIKKPVKLDFLDFSTLERRREYCLQELRLNRRLAPQLYLGVVPITGSPRDPRMDGAGQTIEYALQMREFPQEDLVSADERRRWLAVCKLFAKTRFPRSSGTRGENNRFHMLF